MELVEKKCPSCGAQNYFPNPPLHVEHRCLNCGATIYPEKER